MFNSGPLRHQGNIRHRRANHFAKILAAALILLREYPAEVSLNTLILLRFYSFLF